MKKLLSFVLMFFSVFTALVSGTLFVEAVTYISYGDYLLAVNSDTTYLIGGYTGTETELAFPDSANGKSIIGVSEDFYDKCSAQITSVTMPDSFTVVESFAFYGMTSLEEVVLSPNINSIGTMAFSGCSSLVSINLNDTKIKSVSRSCFSKSGLKVANLPDSVISIASYAFNECVGLESVSLPYGLSTIGEYAFYKDTKLTNVFIPSSVTQISANAFNPMGIDGGTLTLDCFRGSYPAIYAYNNHLNLSAVEKLVGDVDGNNAVNINDVTYIQLYRVGLYELNSKAAELADFSKDGKVALRDATLIQMYLAGMIN